MTAWVLGEGGGSSPSLADLRRACRDAGGAMHFDACAAEIYLYLIKYLIVNKE